MKVLFCGTHPNLDSGYANIVYNLFLNVQKIRHPNDQFVLFAFDAQATTLDRAKDLGMKIISPFRETREPFGESLLAKVVDDEFPDIVVIYNDLLVVNRLLQSLSSAQHRPTKTVVYLDLVYDYQSDKKIEPILNQIDLVMLFTDDWREHLRGYFKAHPVKMKTLNHGLRKRVLKRLSAEEIVEAKQEFGIPLNGVTILNLNRNSWRKRWDLTVKSFVAFLAEVNYDRTDQIAVYLYVGCTLQRDNPGVTYNLLDIIQMECHVRGLDIDKILPHFIFKGNQHFSDQEINRLYNACEIGINTCSGEGFGLCNFEHGYLGRPQIVSYVGGLKSCLKGAYYIQPTGYQYSLEGVGGLAYDFDYRDIVKALKFYYNHPEMREADGERIHQYIENQPQYRWEEVAKTFLHYMDGGTYGGT